MRIVIDTNIVASAIFFGGRPRELMELLLRHELTAFITREIIEEYQGTIAYLQNEYPSKRIAVPLTQIIAACNMIETTSVIRVCRDPDDDKFIACALDSRSIYIVSGDKDLLAVKQYKDVQVVTVAQFFRDIWNPSSSGSGSPPSQ